MSLAHRVCLLLRQGHKFGDSLLFIGHLIFGLIPVKQCNHAPRYLGGCPISAVFLLYNLPALTDFQA